MRIIRNLLLAACLASLSTLSLAAPPVAPAPAKEPAPAAAPAKNAATPATPTAQPTPAEKLLDINTATAEQFAKVMVGVGKAKAEAIVKDREANGKFTSVDDLDRVKGIGKATIEKNRAKLTAK
jgi:competence protein ComEA